MDEPAEIEGPKTSRARNAWLVLLAVCLLVRVVYVLSFPGVPLTGNVGDAKWYHEAGISLRDGDGYVRPAHVTDAGAPTAYFPVGYGFFLSLLFRIFGDGFLVGQLANCLLDIGLILLVYLVLQRIERRAIAVSCALLLAISPSQILWTGFLLSEPLFVLLFLAHILFLLSAARERRATALLWTGGSSGIALGLATLVRGQSILFPLGSFMIVWLGLRCPLRHALRTTLVLTIFMILTVAPWTWRNYAVFGRLVPVSTNAGVNLYMGHHEGATGGYSAPPGGFPGDTELEIDRRSRDLALQYVKQHPLRVLPMGLRKLWMTFRADSILTFREEFALKWGRAGGWLALGIAELYYLATVGLIVGGAWRGVWRGRSAARVALIVIAYFSVIVVLFFGGVRYLYPLNPFLAILATLGFDALRPGVLDRWFGDAAAGARGAPAGTAAYESSRRANQQPGRIRLWERSGPTPASATSVPMISPSRSR